jgi:hypothetical protein
VQSSGGFLRNVIYAIFHMIFVDSQQCGRRDFEVNEINVRKNRINPKSQFILAVAGMNDERE